MHPPCGPKVQPLSASSLAPGVFFWVCLRHLKQRACLGVLEAGKPVISARPASNLTRSPLGYGHAGTIATSIFNQSLLEVLNTKTPRTVIMEEEADREHGRGRETHLRGYRGKNAFQRALGAVQQCRKTCVNDSKDPEQPSTVAVGAGQSSSKGRANNPKQKRLREKPTRLPGKKKARYFPEPVAPNNGLQGYEHRRAGNDQYA